MTFRNYFFRAALLDKSEIMLLSKNNPSISTLHSSLYLKLMKINDSNNDI
jgi:hypothetical protein